MRAERPVKAGRTVKAERPGKAERPVKALRTVRAERGSGRGVVRSVRGERRQDGGSKI